MSKITITETELKDLLVRDKSFLKEIYSGPNPLKNKELLTFADEGQLDTLLKYLHFVANGKITIKKEHFFLVRKHKKLNLLRQKVEKTQSLLKLLNGQRKSKIDFLLKLTYVLPYLLYGLFNLV